MERQLFRLVKWFSFPYVSYLSPVHILSPTLDVFNLFFFFFFFNICFSRSSIVLYFLYVSILSSRTLQMLCKTFFLPHQYFKGVRFLGRVVLYCSFRDRQVTRHTGFMHNSQLLLSVLFLIQIWRPMWPIPTGWTSFHLAKQPTAAHIPKGLDLLSNDTDQVI